MYKSSVASVFRQFVIAVGSLLLLGAAPPLWAQDRLSGVLTQGCAVHWRAASVLSNNNSLAGFTQTVSPGAGEPGYMQIQHWNWDGAVNWRIPVSTDHTVHNATLTVTMSEPGGAWAYTANQALVDFITDRPVFTTPKVYAWEIPPTPPTDNGDGTWTFELGDLAAGTGVIFAFRAPLHPDLGLEGPYHANAVLRGTYEFGSPVSCQRPAPAPVPVNAPWALLALASLAVLAAARRLRPRG